MLIIQFQINNITEQEQEIIPDFCNLLCDLIYKDIDTNIHRKKIQKRLKYLSTVPWIKWKTKNKINLEEIMYLIRESLIYRRKKNIHCVEISDSIFIPNSYTPFVRLLRFLNSGDNYYPAISLITKLIRKYNFQYLNSMWKTFILEELGEISYAEIVTDIC